MCIDFRPFEITTGSVKLYDSKHSELLGKPIRRVVDQARISGNARALIVGAITIFASGHARVKAVACWYVIAHDDAQVEAIGGHVRGFDRSRIVARKGCIAYAFPGSTVEAHDNSVVIVPQVQGPRPRVKLHGGAQMVDVAEAEEVRKVLQAFKRGHAPTVAA